MIAQQPIPSKRIVRQRVEAVVELHDVYKSKLLTGPTVKVDYEKDVPSTSASQPALWTDETAILFLKAISPDAYGFADPFSSATPFHALPQQIPGSGIAKLESTLAVAVGKPNREDQINALRMLQEFDSLQQQSLAAVDSRVDSDNADVALTAIAILLKAGLPSAADRLKHYLENYKSNLQPISLVSVATELGRVTDEKALPAIEALTSSRFLTVRYGAMESLHKMKNPRSASTLVQRLDDSDKTINYLAVITLAQTFEKYDGDYAPSMYVFDKKPEYYVGLWKKWWSAEGSKLYQDQTTDRAQP
jgi:hypothetical protein